MNAGTICTTTAATWEGFFQKKKIFLFTICLHLYWLRPITRAFAPRVLTFRMNLSSFFLYSTSISNLCWHIGNYFNSLLSYKVVYWHVSTRVLLSNTIFKKCIIIFFNEKLMFRYVPSRASGNYAPDFHHYLKLSSSFLGTLFQIWSRRIFEHIPSNNKNSNLEVTPLLEEFKWWNGKVHDSHLSPWKIDCYWLFIKSYFGH